MKEVILINKYNGLPRGKKIIVEDIIATEIVKNKQGIICKDLLSYNNKMVESCNRK